MAGSEQAHGHQEYSGREHRLIYGCVFLKDSRTLVTGDNGGRVVVWDIARAKPVTTWQAHPNGIRAMALTPDGRTLATGGFENVVTLWHTATWRSMLTIEHSGVVYALAFSHDGQFLAIGGAGEGHREITRLWRAASFEETDHNR